MKIVGVIVEYNPLHNGHVYHINKIKQQTNADIIIAVMSGSFTMRGDLSIFNKFTKTKEALENQIDIVCELPSIFTVNNSNIFAKASLSILNKMGVNELIIGSEENDSSIYEEYYNLLKTNEFNETLKNELASGISYKLASINSFKKYNLKSLEANDILGLAYYQEIKDNNYPIILKTIKRIGDSYNNKTITDSEYTSAKAIRFNLESINTYCPKFVKDDYNEWGALDSELLFKYLKYQILSNDNLDSINFSFEGLDNNIKKNIITSNSLNDLIESMTSKRYTSSRIKRYCFYLLFQIKKESVERCINSLDFVRVLGYSEKGLEYLGTIKKETKIYTNIKNGLNEILDIELKISKILDLVYDTNLMKLEQSKPIKKEL